MAIFDKKKQGEGSGQAQPKAPAAPVDTPELYLQTVSMMANLLISNTAAMLGKVPHPESGQTFRSLESAELLIDLLQTLKEKGASRLPQEAQDQIGRAISDLQMLFVQEASVSGDFSKANEMRKEVETAESAPKPKPEPAAAIPAKPDVEPAPAHRESVENKKKFSKKYE